ncbi:hypothetical protein [Oceanivirga miroungae]|uniref:Uncharacterized protein n=1 Tax=Oceanivirga miroungae TaxID=1130046 RepID=A0A6I8ME28_9FUSO|nr:hypothetical protein [Oceanivirga miroungae]VWL85715.1 hypothetical protein OMES3154_01003 [Oceanivirga miroungae]
MKKILLSLALVFTTLISFSHNPDIILKDNKDGTMNISVKFPNDPGDAIGSEISIILDKPYNGSGKTIGGSLVLFQRNLGETEEMTIYKPKTKKFHIHVFVMPGHEYDVTDIYPLSKAEKEKWNDMINNDSTLTQDEKDYLLGNKVD